MDGQRANQVISGKLDIKDVGSQVPLDVKEAALVEAVEESLERHTLLRVRQPSPNRIDRLTAEAKQQFRRLAVERQIARRPPIKDDAAEILGNQHQGVLRSHG